jgi:hypothetical protein
MNKGDPSVACELQRCVERGWRVGSSIVIEGGVDRSTSHHAQCGLQMMLIHLPRVESEEKVKCYCREEVTRSGERYCKVKKRKK